VTTPGDALPASFDQAIDAAIENHPILKSANVDIESAIAQHATAKTAFMPRVDLELSATHNKDIDGIEGVNEDASAMVRLRYNLYNGGKDTARRKETAELINQAKSIRDNTYRQAVESMRLSWIAHQTVKSQMAFFESHKNSSIKSNEAYQKQFNIGRRSLLDLLDSANEMFVAKSAYTNAKYDELYSQFRILASGGALNSYLNVKLPEETAILPTNEPWIGASQKPIVTPTYATTIAE
jgi:adhesin transport system outer membrane protein